VYDDVTYVYDDVTYVYDDTDLLLALRELSATLQFHAVLARLLQGCS